MPWARGSSLLWLIVLQHGATPLVSAWADRTPSYQVLRRMYWCHELLPDSRPPPVSFSPPKAPPISAPLVGMLTFTMPQSDPDALRSPPH